MLQFLLEMIFVCSLLRSKAFLAALRTSWWDAGKAADRAPWVLLLCVLLVVIGGGCNRMRGGWRPYASLGEHVERYLGGTISPGRHGRSIHSLTVTDCHSLGVIF